jgi:hypothetical protein
MQLAAPTPSTARTERGLVAERCESGTSIWAVPVISIPSARITDWESFHDVFAEVLGFPDFYGRNMNAWIDCLMYCDEDDGMRSLVVPAGDVLTLAIENVDEFAARCPEQYEAIVECSAFVNHARLDAGVRPIVALSFHRRR